jgi:hypothetical protein
MFLKREEEIELIKAINKKLDKRVLVLCACGYFLSGF